MKRLWYRLVFLVVAGPLILCCDPSATLICKVTDLDFQPVEGASVQIMYDETEQKGSFRTCREAGRYVYTTIGQIPPGTVMVTHRDYKPDSLHVDGVDPGRERLIHVGLSPSDAANSVFQQP